MRLVGIIGGLVLAASGSIWIFQGLDSAFAPQSFMTNDRTWTFYGGLAVITGISLAAWSWRRER